MSSPLLFITLFLAAPSLDAAVCLQKGRLADGTGSKACFPMQTNIGDGQGEVVGKVCVSVSTSNDALSLQVSANDDWELLRNQVWIGSSVRDIPVLPDRSSVDVSLFPDFAADWEGEENARWSLSNPCTTDDEVAQATMIFVAHSTATKTVTSVEGEEKTVSVWGYEHLTRSVPAPWFDVKVICECSGEV